MLSKASNVFHFKCNFNKVMPKLTYMFAVLGEKFLDEFLYLTKGT